MTELEEALLKAKHLLSESGDEPRDVWHPWFGWVIRDGEPTGKYPAFSEWLKRNEHRIAEQAQHTSEEK